MFLLAVSCALAPEQLDRQARDYGFGKIRLAGLHFEHIAYEKPAAPGSDTLHIYLEGDGSPWLHRRQVAEDPTPRDPLMLKLMSMDTAPALYLGRPCYLGLADDPSCNPLLWTHRRYSAEVVDSMARALRNYLANQRYSRLVFAGHSGGGTLAVLMARQFPETVTVVSLAGNLDIDRWAAFHRFSMLEGSQNPAKLPPLPETVKEIHFVGENDENIRPEFVLPRKNSRSNVEVRIIENFDHRCCWEQLWPAVLNQIAVH